MIGVGRYIYIFHGTGASIYLDIEPGLFVLPEEINTPIICVGPGTGVAPMRAVIQERVAKGANGNLRCTWIYLTA
jgi:sulfite reductase alpha subunit-like flavoprotein